VNAHYLFNIVIAHEVQKIKRKNRAN